MDNIKKLINVLSSDVITADGANIAQNSHFYLTLLMLLLQYYLAETGSPIEEIMKEAE